MSSERIFENWKQHKQDFAVSDNFCENIMQTVTVSEKQKARVDLLLWFNALTTEPLARFGIIIIGAIGGLCRIILTLISVIYQSVPLT